MTARGVSRLLLAFAREVRAGGPRAALRRAVRYLTVRSGVAHVEEVKVLGSEIQALREDLDRRETTIRLGLSAQAEAIAWLVEHYEAGSRPEPRPAAQTAGPLVSVILPVWNRDQLLPQAVASVERQTYTNWELLVIDDGRISCP